MAKTGISLLPAGNIDGLSIYKLGTTQVMRRGWGPSKKRINKDPKYIRTRENNAEFRASVQAATLLRHALGVFIKGKAYKRPSHHLNKVMLAIKDLDKNSDRGERRPALGLKTEDGKKLLCAFEFNGAQSLNLTLKQKVQCDWPERKIVIKDFIAKRDLKFPKASTHARFSAILAVLNLEEGCWDNIEMPELIVDKKNPQQTIVINAHELPEKEGFRVFALRIDFLQKVKDDIYSLQSNESTCAAVVGVQEL